MGAALSILLLLIGVAGAVFRPFRLPPWAVAVGAVVVELAAGVTQSSAAGSAIRPLTDPVAFLLTAVPLAVLLDRLGFFEAVAGRITRRGGGPGSLWVLGALVTTVLNLDAGVVLLTPLYVRIARQRGSDALALAVMPVLLACLASSALPVSNLTNLIAASWTGAGTSDFLVALGLPSLAACTVGWLCYRATNRSAPMPAVVRARGASAQEAPAGGSPATMASTESSPTSDAPVGSHADDRFPLRVGGVVVLGVLAGFTLGRPVHLTPWEVALAADIALVVVDLFRRRGRFSPKSLPWREIPIGTALVALSLGVLAASAAVHLPVHLVVKGGSVLALARTAAAAALGANVVNNLPALLVALPSVGHHPGPVLWAVLIGVNMGPVLLVTGSLASLLWMDTLGRLDVPVRPRDFTVFGLRIGLPGAVAGLAVHLALHALGFT
jgi:arsenical pump membrane protein